MKSIHHYVVFKNLTFGYVLIYNVNTLEIHKCASRDKNLRQREQVFGLTVFKLSVPTN